MKEGTLHSDMKTDRHCFLVFEYERLNSNMKIFDVVVKGHIPVRKYIIFHHHF